MLAAFTKARLAVERVAKESTVMEESLIYIFI